MRIETERLILRDMTENDYAALHAILTDAETMKHYPKPYDDAGVRRWLDFGFFTVQPSEFAKMAVVLYMATTLTYRYSTPMLKDFEMTVVYAVRTDDAVEVTVNWPGAADLPDMPALGLSFQLDPRLNRISYYGYGPEENYADRREGALLDNYTYQVKDGMSPYLNPQESGNRGGVQSLSITDKDQHGVLVMGDNLEVSVQRWLPEQLSAAGSTTSTGATCSQKM